MLPHEYIFFIYLFSNLLFAICYMHLTKDFLKLVVILKKN